MVSSINKNLTKESISEGEEKYENISMFLVFFFFAHLQIFRLYCKLNAPKERKVQCKKITLMNGIIQDLKGEQSLKYPILFC